MQAEEKEWKMKKSRIKKHSKMMTRKCNETMNWIEIEKEDMMKNKATNDKNNNDYNNTDQ